MKHKILSMLAIAIVLSAFAPLAVADTLYFNVPNSGFSGSAPQPMGQILLTQVGSTAVDFAITMYGYAPNIQYTLAQSLGMSLSNVANLSISNISAVSQAGAAINNWTLNVITNANPSQWASYDGFGKYNIEVVDNNSHNNTTGNAVTLNFRLTRTVGTLSVADFLSSPSSNCPTGCEFAAHVNELNTQTGANFATGFGGSGPGATVPEPASLALFGSGLLGIGGMFRRRFLS